MANSMQKSGKSREEIENIRIKERSIEIRPDAVAQELTVSDDFAKIIAPFRLQISGNYKIKNQKIFKNQKF